MIKPNVSDIDSEYSVIGCILHDSSVIPSINGNLKPADFTDSRLGDLFQIVMSMYDHQSFIDIVTINREVKKQITTKGFPDLLEEAADSVPSANGIAHYSKIVLDNALIRRLSALCRETVQIIEERHLDPSEAVGRLETGVSEIANISADISHQEQMPEITQSFYNDYINGSLPDPIPAGLFQLDEMLGGGFRPEEFIVIGGNPSMGKTAIAITAAVNQSTTGVHVGFISLEMDRKSLGQRAIAMVGKVNLLDMRKRNLSDNELEKMQQAIGALSDATLFIDDQPGLTISQVRAKCRHMVHKDKCQIIYIDYLQLISPDKDGRSKNEEVGNMTKSLKNLCRELKIPIIVLSQLSRGNTNRENQRPKMSDLRDSGSIEQDADIVLFPYRPSYANRNNPSWVPNDGEEYDEIGIAKQRNGPCGIVRSHFEEEFGLWKA